MKYLIAYSALFAAVLASPMGNGNTGDDDDDMGGKTCESEQTVVCSGNGNGGLISLGNILNGLLGESCSGGDVYCCETGKVEQIGLINLNLDLECSLNHLL
ncbi:hypothetical protein N7448_002302 [Penicillium atrosanguineum]|uniref:Hydrophobin n=1 Tax=Penicillium atrosanguineum TaxID=1132637 RepID=A0A9W9LAE8_9EURO|nr:uncharacterized protein N7443_005706 [Penicillium atrosanguineum]KAJ5128585.1 hypothetical protein N7526_006751 [Penicillium atrosanguineum]KAJ5144910.1 hypothetical protein N7448_002302 [Penicillium atrosanguineum]KAJ5300704.1 hypothetical protein N7443_005706 [Penicillium atrosanguineum]KAJ5311345.1 hypothetical protein N7476_007205 [Penicillium atrosanguineum]